MKRNLVVVLSLVLIFGASAVLAAGGGLHTGASPESSTAGVSVNIPGVIGIDVETDMVWNFGSYTAQAAGAAVPCPANNWPLQPNCTGTADYAPNVSVTSAAAPNPGGNAGEVWMAVFSNIGSGAVDIQAAASAFATNPWSTYTAADFVMQAEPPANNPKGVGFATWTAVPQTAGSIGKGSLGAAFNWTRADQDFKFTLAAPAGAATFTPGTYSTFVTFTITHT